MSHQCLFNSQSFNSGQELNAYHRSQVKKHGGSALAKDPKFKKALEVQMPSLLWFLFEELLKFRKCRFSTFHTSLGNSQLCTGNTAKVCQTCCNEGSIFDCHKMSPISPLLFLLFTNSQSTTFTEQSCVPLD